MTGRRRQAAPLEAHPATTPFMEYSMSIETLEDLFHHTLKDVLYAERKLLKVLPKMGRKAGD